MGTWRQLLLSNHHLLQPCPHQRFLAGLVARTARAALVLLAILAAGAFLALLAFRVFHGATTGAFAFITFHAFFLRLVCQARLAYTPGAGVAVASSAIRTVHDHDESGATDERAPRLFRELVRRIEDDGVPSAICPGGIGDARKAREQRYEEGDPHEGREDREAACNARCAALLEQHTSNVSTVC